MPAFVWCALVEIISSARVYTRPSLIEVIINI